MSVHCGVPVLPVVAVVGHEASGGAEPVPGSVPASAGIERGVAVLRLNGGGEEQSCGNEGQGGYSEAADAQGTEGQSKLHSEDDSVVNEEAIKE